MRRLLQLAYVEDFKLLGGQTRGEETAHALSRKWRRVPELLIMADANAIRDQATYAPPQLRFFLRVAARVCKNRKGEGGGVLALRYETGNEQNKTNLIQNMFGKGVGRPHERRSENPNVKQLQN